MKFLKYIIWVIFPIGLLHLLVIAIRNKLYDRRALEIEQLPRPVISIGNIQMGGTGKTPTVLALIKLLESSGKKVGVLTRGYKSGAQALVLPAGTEEIDVKQIGG